MTLNVLEGHSLLQAFSGETFHIFGMSEFLVHGNERRESICLKPTHPNPN